MKTKPRLRLLAVFLAVSSLVPAAFAATPILSDGFESGMSSWTQWNGTASGWSTATDPLNSGNSVLSSTNAGRTESIVRSLGGSFDEAATLSLDIYSGSAGGGWNFRGLLLSGASSTAPGYGFYITENGGVRIHRYDQGWATLNGSAGAPAIVEIGTGSAAGIWKTDAWNAVSFQWFQNGGFSLLINDSIVATAVDTTYGVGISRLVFQKFTNNTTSGQNPVTGRVLLFDNVALAPIPEPTSAAALFSLIALMAVCGRRTSLARR